MNPGSSFPRPSIESSHGALLEMISGPPIGIPGTFASSVRA